MRLSNLFTWIYQLSPSTIIRTLIIYTIVFLLLDRQLKERHWWRILPAALLSIWLTAALWVTLLSRGETVVGDFQIVPLHSYQAVLSGGNQDILRSNFMNVVLFFPGGLLLEELLPSKWPFWARLLTTTALLGSVSLAIELIQYFRMLGQAEIDDLIHNTLGALLGCLAVSFGTEKIFIHKRRDLP